MEVSIRLPRGEWFYDDAKLLGQPGGFGSVFSGRSPSGTIVAVKRLKLDARAATQREMAVVDAFVDKTFAHIIPVLDAGQDAESDEYFVVMAKADKSLKDELDSGIRFDSSGCAKILLDIASGLNDAAQIVHRDLKPANILHHDGTWKIADFGIARFIEESTSFETLKGCLTLPYAAPEQFQGQRVSNATDIYSLGCIAYALMTGKPPFSGPGYEEYKNQHLELVPSPIPGADARLQSLLSAMLRKVPDGRPTRDRVKLQLQVLAEPSSSPLVGASRELADATATLTQARAVEEARRRAAEERAKNRGKQQSEAVSGLKESVVGKLFNVIAESCADCQRGSDSISVDGCQLQLQVTPTVIPENAFSASEWDVISIGNFLLQQSSPQYVWTSTLLYAKHPNSDEFRWYEVLFYLAIRRGSRIHTTKLTNLTKHLSEIDTVFARTNKKHSVAFGPVPIDHEETEEFCKRWVKLLTRACTGKLSEPLRFPLSEEDF